MAIWQRFFVVRSPLRPITIGRRRRMRLVRDDDMMLDEEPEPTEPADGAVEDVDDAETNDSDASELPPVDLAALEALLFSTHHPLTAGRLAEFLDIDSTKAIRNAIKELNK